MQRLASSALTMFWLAAGPGAALAQYRPSPAPYTPPTVYAPPRAFEHTAPAPPVPIPPPLVVVPGKDGEKPSVIVPPPPIPPPDALVDPVEQILEELGRCLAHGTTQLVDCLRQNHNSVSIRRLEACLGSESIPEEASGVRACLAAGHW